MTLRALILARYFGIAIQKKQVHEFYKGDIPDSCNQGFGANVCQSIIDLKHAFLKVSDKLSELKFLLQVCINIEKKPSA